ncbi:MAG: hypothetical protein ACLU8F_05880 [Clostridia bacterium]
MKEKGRISISNIISVILIIVILVTAFQIFKRYNYVGYKKAENTPYTSKFLRDNKEKIGKAASYEIKSDKFNDAMFSKKVKVEKNTPYKVTCMVKTEGVEKENVYSTSGAQICVGNTIEKSISITGTQDWQRLEFIFDSKNREEVEIGFRLGGYEGKCKGTAWFTDFTIESGVADTSSEWNFACILLENVNVNVDKNGQIKPVQVSMTESDMRIMEDNMERFQASCKRLSNYQMSVKYDIIRVAEPITHLTYDKENGYYISPSDAHAVIQKYIQGKEYDHIFICTKLGNEIHKKDIEVKDWIGLGGMDYYGIGFSNIRLPNEENSYIYRYGSSINTFPEEVFIHEFLHYLERNSHEHGYEIPALHDSEKYGYQNAKLIGLEDWYRDYMQGNITDGNRKIGLNSAIYTTKPPKESDFNYSYKMDSFDKKTGFLQDAKDIFTSLGQIFKKE